MSIQVRGSLLIKGSLLPRGVQNVQADAVNLDTSAAHMDGSGIMAKDNEEDSKEELLTRPAKPSHSLPILDSVFGVDISIDDYILDDI